MFLTGKKYHNQSKMAEDKVGGNFCKMYHRQGDSLNIF